MFRQEVVPECARKGYMIGLDGRKIWVPSEHLATGAYLQGFESVVMKYAMKLYHEELRSKGVVFQQVSYTHDEFGIECPKECATVVGETVAWSIEEAGKVLGSLCPLKGKWSSGSSWAESH